MSVADDIQSKKQCCSGLIRVEPARQQSHGLAWHCPIPSPLAVYLLLLLLLLLLHLVPVTLYAGKDQKQLAGARALSGLSDKPGALLT